MIPIQFDTKINYLCFQQIYGNIYVISFLIRESYFF